MKRILGVLLLSAALVAGLAAQDLFLGLGRAPSFRVGPGKDSAGVQVYSFNYVYAAVVFDKAGKIVDIEVDGLEVATPNYDGESMPHFPGWPGSVPYNFTDHASKKVAGTSPTNVEAVAEAVNKWQTKRDRGDNYGMNPKNDWYHQMDRFEKIFIGKTVDELDAWFKKYLSDVNGRPLNPATTNEKDKAKVDPLSAAEKAMLVDVRSGATMSLNDSHGSFVTLIRDAWDKRKPFGGK